MVSRIKQLLEWQQLSPTQFADRIGVGRPVISHILSERNKPSLEVARSIKAAFPELSLDWLLNGSGEMLSGVPPVPLQPPAAAVSPVVPANLGGTPQAAVAPVVAPAATLSNAAGQVKPAKKQQAYQTPAAGLAAPGRFTAGTAAPVSPPPARIGVRRFVAASAPASSSQEPPLQAAFNSALSPDTAFNAGLAGSADQEIVPAAVPAAPYAPAAPAPAEMAGLAQALTGEIGESGKAIRRIVIFYSDGSFADYKPETQA